ncbi:MAG: GNAT family N-acetyltransferase, partial [Cyclobacteriaceae bacterium]|nr:GNAT family N-acetyltransferase [Cyclobacteriaceae bacterium]
MTLSIPEHLETRRLLLSRLRYEDAEEIFYAYASKPEATRYVSWPTHQRVEDTRAFLRYAHQSWNAGTDYSFAIRLKEHHRLIGSFGLINDAGKIQFGYILGPLHWGAGYATEACIKLMEVVRTMAGVYRVQTFVDTENVASIRVLQKSGLLEEARLPKWFRFVNQGNEPKDCVLFRLDLPA